MAGLAIGFSEELLDQQSCTEGIGEHISRQQFHRNARKFVKNLPDRQVDQTVVMSKVRNSLLHKVTDGLFEDYEGEIEPNLNMDKHFHTSKQILDHRAGAKGRQ